MRLHKNIILATLLSIALVWAPNHVAGQIWVRQAADVPVVTPPLFYPQGFPGHVDDPWPYAPSVVIGPQPLRCLEPDAPMNNPTCPAIRAKVSQEQADNTIIARLLRSRKGGCFPHWPSVVTDPPNGVNRTYRKCGRGREFNSDLRAIRTTNNDYIDFAANGIPAGSQPGV